MDWEVPPSWPVCEGPSIPSHIFCTWLRIRSRSALRDHKKPPVFNQANPTSTTTKSGWVVGGGAEWMATPNILLRAEYLYYGIDSSNNLSAVAFPIPAPLPVAVNWGKETIQVFRIAGSYKF